MTLLALALALAPAQSCAVDLPLPPTSVVRLGQLVAATDDWVAATDATDQVVHLWERTAGAGATFAVSLTPTAGRVRSIDVDGDRLAVVSGSSAGNYSLNVWERDAAGTWIEGAAFDFSSLVPLSTPVQIEGDTLVAVNRGSSSGPRSLSVFDRDPQSGVWSYSQGITYPSGGGFAFGLKLEAGRIFALAGSFSNRTVATFGRSGASFSLDEELASPDYNGFFDASGDRLGIVGDDWVDVWRRDPGGWVREQRLGGANLRGVVRVALNGRWLSATVFPPSSSGFVPGPVQVFERQGNSGLWLAKEAALPPGGLGVSSEAFSEQLAGSGSALFVCDNEFAPFGRISGIDLSCLQAPPVLHWADVRLSLPTASSWPSQGRTLQIQSSFPFDPGPPYGLRDPSLDLVADYMLDITGRQCNQDYGSNVCAFAAFAFQDGLTGATTTPFPIDPFSGNPQLFDVGPGPLVVANTMDVQIPWPFLFEGTVASANDLVPSGAPMDLRLAADMYNCIDFGGIWAPDSPNVEAFGCGYVSLPASVTSLQLDVSGTGEVAFNFPALGPGLQATICDGGVNGAGSQATLEAVGSSAVVDNALYFDVTGLIPETAGILFLSPQAATPPFDPLGFGSLCLGSPLARVPGSLGVADASGNAALRLDLQTLPPGVQPQPGSTWAAQWMYRDQGFVNTSSAQTVMFQ